MPYSFRRDDADIESGVRRIAQSQLGKALDAYGDPGRSVAERIGRCRGALGRVTSLLDLVGEVCPRHRAETEALGGAAALLDGIGDLAADIAVVRRHEAFLAGEIGAADTGSLLDRLTGEIAAREARAEVAAPLIQFRVALLSAWERAGSWSLTADGGEAISEGLRRAYAAAQEAHGAARADGGAFPGWRRAARAHRDHTRLLRRSVRGPMAAHLAMADVLAEALDDHRDLARLDRLIESRPVVGSAAARRTFTDLRAQIEPPALALGAALFAEPPEGLARRFATYWEVSRGGLLDAGDAPPPKAIAAL